MQWDAESCYLESMSNPSNESPASPLAPPSDPGLVKALEAFEAGNFEQSWAALDAVESPQGDDLVYADRLNTARTLDPALIVMFAAGLIWWLFVFGQLT